MNDNSVKAITLKIIELQDKDNCWDVIDKTDKGYPELQHYVPIYKSTLWTLILLADIECDYKNKNLLKPLKIISDHFLDKKSKIYSIGKS